MRFDLSKAEEFLKAWDAHRANRAKVARLYEVNRSHGYDLAERCRQHLDSLGQATNENGPLPSS